MDIQKIQSLLQSSQLDGWLFCDYHGRDHISREFLALSDRFCTRRMFYYIPAVGTPVKVLSAIEPLLLDHLQGDKLLYKGKDGLHQRLAEVLPKGAGIACQYSPGGNVPTASTMDAGLFEYLRSFGVELVSSADLLQHFGAVLTPEQIESHQQAGVIVHRILDETFRYIRACIDSGEYLDEYKLLLKMQQLIAAEPIHMDSPPFFGVDDHACDPGYEPKEQGSYEIKNGSRLIIDFAARLRSEDAVYYDISWCMNVGEDIDPEYTRLFNAVNDARTMVLGLIQSRLDADEPIRGCDVDRAVQDYFKARDLDKYLMHRTGHNIGHRCHGVGANLDDYETHDVRTLLPGTMFSVEPGIYTDKYGVRLEFDVHITPDKKLRIYGPVQNQILVI